MHATAVGMRHARIGRVVIIIRGIMLMTVFVVGVRLGAQNFSQTPQEQTQADAYDDAARDHTEYRKQFFGHNVFRSQQHNQT